jgi:Ni/Co efflux regulator RcnB
MKRLLRTALILALAASVATPTLADNDRGKDRKKVYRTEHNRDRDREHRRRDRDHDDDRREYRDDYSRRSDYGFCPPGLAKKHNGCQPPGQARKHYRRGDTLRGDYYRVRDYDRYDLERRDSWDYYRDDDRIYRVDRNTRKILAVIELLDAFN